ncbi:MAG: lipoprotein insertase outer membrane protein LolB [Betaproteobacteria bacterium]
MNRPLRAIVLLASLALAACAQLTPLGSQDVIEFELAGRIATRYKDEAASGNVAWRHSGEADEMLITTPVGSSIARVVRNGKEVVLTTAEPRDYHATDAEAITEQVLGFRLPLAGLTDWVRGKAMEGVVTSVTRGADGRLATLDQNGWRIEYQEYRADGLPVRLKLNYPGIELRLAIHEWKLGPQVR